MANVMNRETAEAEVTAWLDKKKVFQETRERYKDHLEVLAEAMMNGVITLDQATFVITHNLLFPLGEGEMKSLKYKSRINDKMMLPHLKGVKSDDADMRLNALLAALTDENKTVIMAMDSQDKRIAVAIGVFFM